MSNQPFTTLDALIKLRDQEEMDSLNRIHSQKIRDRAKDRFDLLTQTLETLCDEYGVVLCKRCNQIADEVAQDDDGVWVCEKHVRADEKQIADRFYQLMRVGA